MFRRYRAQTSVVHKIQDGTVDRAKIASHVATMRHHVVHCVQEARSLVVLEICIFIAILLFVQLEKWSARNRVLCFSIPRNG